MIDTHCHLFNEYYEDVDKIVDNAINNGVNYMISNSTNKENMIEMLELSKRNKNVYIALGFQPEDITNTTIEDLSLLEDNIDNIVAIGEIGLDYYNSLVPRDTQINIFEKQLALAEKYNKPVIIHTRNAYEDTINSLKKFPEVKGIIHCFSEDIDKAYEYIKLGYKLGIGGIVTFKNSDLSEVVKNISLNDIVLETDSPYLAPVPLRGKRNEPANIKLIAEKIAEIKNISLDEVKKTTTKNVKDLFDI